MPWSIKRWLPFTTALAADLNQIRTNLEALKLHTHDGSDGDGSDLVYGGATYVQLLPSMEYSGNWAIPVESSTSAFRGYLQTSAGTNGQYLLTIIPPLCNGTWRFDMLHPKGPDMGIVTVSYNGITWGTIDCYAAGASNNNTSSLTGVTVSDFAPGVLRYLRLEINSKNASASAYYGRVHFIAMRRTGA